MEKVISTLSFLIIVFGINYSAHAEESAEELNSQGASFAEQGKNQEAYLKFQEAVNKDSKLAKAQSNLGQMAIELGQKRVAYKAYTSYVLLSPDADDHVASIKILVDLRAELKEALPANVTSAFNDGRNQAKAKDYNKAQKSFQKGIDSAPWALEGYFLKATNFAVQGEKDDANEAMDEYAKYSTNTSDTATKRTEVNSILTNFKMVEKAEKKAEKKEDDARSAGKHAGFSFMLGTGTMMPNLNAFSDNVADDISYKDMLENPQAFDFNFYVINPDANSLMRIGFSIHKFKAKNKSIPVLVNPKLNTTTVDIKSTDMKITSIYGGLGFGGDLFYVAFDLGVMFLSINDLETSVTSGSTEIKKIPTNETALFGSMSFGTHIPLSSLFSLNIEARYTAPPFITIYQNSKKTGTEPGVEGARWFGIATVFAGISIRI